MTSSYTPHRIQIMDTRAVVALCKDWTAHPEHIVHSIETNARLLSSSYERQQRAMWAHLIEVVPEAKRMDTGRAFLRTTDTNAPQQSHPARLVSLMTAYNVNPKSREGIEIAVRSWPIMRQWSQQRGESIVDLAWAAADLAMLAATCPEQDVRLLEWIIADTKGVERERHHGESLLHRWVDRIAADGLPVGSRAALALLLNHDLDVNERNARGFTALAELATRRQTMKFRDEPMGWVLDAGACWWEDLGTEDINKTVRDHPFVRRAQLMNAQAQVEQPAVRPKGRL